MWLLIVAQQEFSLCWLFPHSLPAMLQVDACYHSYWSPTYIIPTYDDMSMNKHSRFCCLVGRRMLRILLTTWNWKSLTYFCFTETWIRLRGTKLLHSSRSRKWTSSWPQMLQASTCYWSVGYVNCFFHNLPSVIVIIYRIFVPCRLQYMSFFCKLLFMFWWEDYLLLLATLWGAS